MGRPKKPYEVKRVSVTLNIKHYHTVKSEGTNMSKLINVLLDAYFEDKPLPEYTSVEKRLKELEHRLSELES